MHFQSLQNIMTGYTLPEPAYEADLKANIDKLFKALKDPKLPLLELQVTTLNPFNELPWTKWFKWTIMN